ncbi:MAG: hypothetical protein JWQ38_2048 [Flavipsychrobacter sp.]|nr:hypothetical protein [Flavipsychrobacter sp.]
MKKLFLFATALIAASVTAIAQPTLTAATFSPVAGDVFHGHFCDTNMVSKGASGANVLWDMASLVRHDSDTTYYLSCMPSCDSFAGANLISATPNGDTSYYNSGSGGYYTLGYYTTGGLVRYLDSMTMISYPFAYTNSLKDTAYTHADLGGGDYVDLYMYNTITYDGYGTLKLPTGVFKNAVRLHLNTITESTGLFFGFPFSTLNNTDSYSWFVAGFHSPLLTIAYDTMGSPTVPYVSDVVYYTGTGYSPNIPALSFNDAHINSSFTVSPNPATSEVDFSFQLGNAAAASLTISDVTGRTVGTIPAASMKQGANNITFPVSQLTPGMYIARLQTADGIQSHKFVVGR